MANRFSKEVKEVKEVQDRVHNQVGHREGRIEIRTELYGHEEVFDREKAVSQLEGATEAEKKA